MENLITRYRNVTILVAVLFAQVVGLAVQVKRSSENQSTRLIRIWTNDAITPLEKGTVDARLGFRNLWRNYMNLRGVRQENRDLKQQIEQLRIEQTRLNEDAQQAHRLQALLGFKEQFISQTLAAQVIGSSGSEQSKSVYIDKGARDGIRQDMAVITADGIVGKVLRVFPSSSQVLLVNDQTSGVGSILEKSRLQGVLRGTANGEVVLEKVMADEPVQPGETVLTSGGDQIFPKGLVVGTVTKVAPGPELFLKIQVKPAADLSRIEEVLVITQTEDKTPEVADTEPQMRASDILAQRLPTVPDKPADATKPTTGAVTPNPQPAGAGAGTAAPGVGSTASPLKPNAGNASQKPAKPVTAPQNSHPQPALAKPQFAPTDTPTETQSEPAKLPDQSPQPDQQP
jgi:rod shape-determining protein MreC